MRKIHNKRKGSFVFLTAALVLCLLAGSLLIACGGNSSSQNTPAGQEMTEGEQISQTEEGTPSGESAGISSGETLSHESGADDPTTPSESGMSDERRQELIQALAAKATFTHYKDPFRGTYVGTAFSLNTICTITFYDEKDVALYEGCADILNKYERMLSRTLKTSEIARLNRREISEVSDETAELIKWGLRYCELSEGAYDIAIATVSSLWDFTADVPKVPAAKDIEEAIKWVDYHAVHVDGNKVTFDNNYVGIDLGSIAKGYIAEKLHSYLVENGVKSAIISLGGNMIFVGSKPDGSTYGSGLQLPFGSSGTEYFAVVRGTNMSIVTSGVYERYFKAPDGTYYHHILDPSTGYSVKNNIYSVSIIGPNSTDCDALSTTLFCLGVEDGMKLINSLDDYYAVFYLENGQILTSLGLEEAYSYQEAPHEHLGYESKLR